MFIVGGGYHSDMDAPTPYPVTNGAYDTRENSGTIAFVSKFDRDLITLTASTYIGGDGNNEMRAIALDASGSVLVTGITSSDNFPATVNAFDSTFNGDEIDTFVSKLNNGLNRLVASTYIGGSNHDEVTSMALGPSGNVFITGFTESHFYPTTSGVFDNSFNGGTDVFVSELINSLSSLVASVLIGGDGSDVGSSIALDSRGDVLIAGVTSSSNYPFTPMAFSPSINVGPKDGFVTKISKGFLDPIVPLKIKNGSNNDIMLKE